MVERIRALRPAHHFFAWFARGNRLVGLIVITALVAGAALIYGIVNDRSQSAANKRADAASAAFYACVPRYVRDLSQTNLPRTIASIAASNARYYWDTGHDPSHPTWDKAKLKTEYERLYRRWQLVQITNPPLPAFSAKYCEGKPTPSPTPSASKQGATRHSITVPSSPSTPSGSSSTTSKPSAGGSHGTTQPPSDDPTNPTLTGELLPGTQSLLCLTLPLACGLRLP